MQGQHEASKAEASSSQGTAKHRARGGHRRAQHPEGMCWGFFSLLRFTKPLPAN